MREFPLFGPGGNSDAFYAAGHKSTQEAPAWLSSIGLTAYEYEAGQGVNAGEASLTRIGEAARQAGIHMSLHTPYFISLSGVIPEKRLKSIDYISQSLWAARLLGAETIVVHPGSCAKISRKEAMALVTDTLVKTLETLDLGDVKVGLETMGKLNQVGTLDEVITLCKIDPHFVPVVDFGHMNARERGGVFVTSDDYRRVFDTIGTELGDEVARDLHCHFSKIMWTDAGEKKHLTFADTEYGPAFEPLAEVLVKENLTPCIICESDGTMSDDALYMRDAYLKAKG